MTVAENGKQTNVQYAIRLAAVTTGATKPRVIFKIPKNRYYFYDSNKSHIF